MGFPIDTSGKEHACHYRRHKLDPWVRKITWRRKWKPTSVFLPEKYHGQRNLAGYNLWGPKRVGPELVAKQLQNCSKIKKSIIQNKTKLSVSWQPRFKPRLFWFQISQP